MDPEQLVAQLAELRTQNQQLHQALQQVQQQNQQQGLVQALSDLPQSLAQTVGAAALAAASPARANPTSVDTKGLGKPPPLKNTEIEFVSWARRTKNFVVSVHPGARDVLTWAVERDSATVSEANAATEVVMPLDTLRMLADQLKTVPMTFVEGESFDILVGHGSGEGLEAWRRLHKRWDPLTTGRARGLLKKIVSPGRAMLVELQGAVERLEDLMRRYTQRRDARNGQVFLLKCALPPSWRGDLGVDPSGRPPRSTAPTLMAMALCCLPRPPLNVLAIQTVLSLYALRDARWTM